MPPDRPTVKTRLTHAVFGDIIYHAVTEATAAISVRVDDTPGWNRLAPAGSFDTTLRGLRAVLRTGSHDRDFAEWYQD